MHRRLASGEWKNDPYVRRVISDPKPRVIHIASVRDRILYQAVYQQLYQIFDATFIHDSYASREGKGTHAGVRRLEEFSRKVSANYTKRAFVLECDIKKFFDNIDRALLFRLIAKRISDERLLALIHTILASFVVESGKGLPLGNVTSQLFANIYLHELDQFVKHRLKARYYIRYCDDFVLLHECRELLETWTENIHAFLRDHLLLELHSNKVTIRKLRQGADFLGYVTLPHYRALRTRTKNRMLKRLATLAGSIQTANDFDAAIPVLSSYLGMLSHCSGERTRQKIQDFFSSSVCVPRK